MGIEDREDNIHLPATTTLEQDRHSRNQRDVNLTWEFTQALIAVIITSAVIYCAIAKITSPELTNAFFLIVGFYFGRTNHQRVGGVQLGR